MSARLVDGNRLASVRGCSCRMTAGLLVEVRGTHVADVEDVDRKEGECQCRQDAGSVVGESDVVLSSTTHGIHARDVGCRSSGRRRRS